MQNSKLVKRLEQDVKALEKQIKRRKFCNFRSRIIRLLAKTGMHLDFLLPFVIAAVVTRINPLYDNPFEIEEVTEKAKVESIDTSTGIHSEKSSFDHYYDGNDTFEHSTGWVLNSNGLFERTVTSYRIDSSVDLSEVDKFLSMTKEEVEQIFQISNIKKIQKSVLELPEDELYYEDMLLIYKVYDDEKNVRVVEETGWDNAFDVALNLLGFLVTGLGIKGIKKVIMRTYVSDKLKLIESSAKIVGSEELKEMKKILLIRKENLDMLLGPSVDSSDHSNKVKRL